MNAIVLRVGVNTCLTVCPVRICNQKIDKKLSCRRQTARR